MKSYTDIEQSKKLAEFLPNESADMSYRPYREEGGMPDYQLDLCPYRFASWIGFPCWSLSVLFRVLPKYIRGSRLRMDISESDFNLWFDFLSSGTADESLPDITKENPVDTCVEMILKLHEQELL